MSGRLEGRVAIVTGAGRGLGAEHAKALAREGARVVVNDLGGDSAGAGSDPTPAQQTVEEIKASGGEAVVNGADISDWDGAAQLVQCALDSFGRIDVLVNNAGILRDRMLVNMSTDEWDDIMRVHLRGHFCPTRLVAAHWRERAKTEGPSDAVMVHTSSISGLHGNVGQANYAAAKSAIATFSIVCHMELNERYGVRSYALAPGARTRLTLQTPGAEEQVKVPEDSSVFDYWNPANVSPFVAWVASPKCPAPSGTVFLVQGDEITRYQTWSPVGIISAGGERWTMDSLDDRFRELFTPEEWPA
ncbi:MAG: SDR family NAD(P)-dependent oxidoreductase [Acidimicrobiia bacterium]|nr:SDR family NAD(P)-dependent oxidoreductase [Acidimicrobiia bacterium]